LDENEEPDFEQLQQIYSNAQASLVLLSSLGKDEFDRVNGLEKAKDIWDTLQREHEGIRPMKKAKRQLIEGNLIDLSCLVMTTLKRCTTGSRS
jgi:hypothetical protein